MKGIRLLQAVVLSGALVLPATAQTAGSQAGQTGSQAGQTGSRTGQTDSRTSPQGETRPGQTGTQGGRTTPQADETAPRTGRTGATQSAPGQSGTATIPGGHVAGTAGTTDQDAKVGPSERQFMMKAAQSGLVEVRLAQMAQEKAASDEVKQYARQLEQDHKKANEQLKDIAQERSVDLPSDITDKHEQHINKLQNLSGEQFDRAFMRLQVDHHKKDLKEFKKQANRGMDTAVKEFAEAQVPVLEKHLQQAQQLAANTGTRSRSGNTGMTSQGAGASQQGASQSGAQGATHGTGTTDHGSSSKDKNKQQ